jgi:hypothetical protein
MSIFSTVETTAGGAATGGPVGALAGFIGSILPSIGSKYTKSTHVTRCVAAMQSGDDQTAGTLIDQAIYHGWIQTGIPDATDWRGITATIYQQATPKWRNYIELVLNGAPLQYANVGATVPNPTSISGIPPGITTPGGSSIGQAISDFLGLGQTAQQAAVSGGQAAGSAIGRGIVVAAVIVGVVVVLVLLLRRK